MRCDFAMRRVENDEADMEDTRRTFVSTHLFSVLALNSRFLATERLSPQPDRPGT